MTGRAGAGDSGTPSLSTAGIMGVPIRAAGRRAQSIAASSLRLLHRAEGAGWALADQCLISAANFFTIYVFARHLDASVFGTFVLANTGLLFLTNVQNALVMVPHGVLGAPLPRPEYQRFTGALIVAQLLLSVAIAVPLAVVGGVLWFHDAPTAGGALIALAVTIVPFMGREFVRRALYTRGESRGAVLNDGITYSLQLVGAIGLTHFLAHRASPEAALFVLGGASLIGVLLAPWQLRHHVRLTRHAGGASMLQTWREVWRFSKWLTARSAVLMVTAQAHAWITALLLGAEQLGIYRAVTHPINVMNPMAQTFANYFSPRGSRAYDAAGAGGLSRWVRRAAWALPLALLPFCLVLIGMPEQVLRLAYGEKYAGTTLAWVLALATLQQWIFFSKHPFEIGLLVLRSTKAVFWAGLIGIVLLLTVGVTLIYSLGLVGVPVAGILINAVLWSAFWFAYRQRLQRETTV